MSAVAQAEQAGWHDHLGRADAGAGLIEVWRRHGEPLFALLTLGVFLLEGTSLGVLTWSLLFRGGTPAGGLLSLRNVLVGAVSLTAIALVLVTAIVLGFRSASAGRDERFVQSVAQWRGRWDDVIDRGAACPVGPITPEALTALLDAREDARAESARRAESAIRETGADRVLLRRLELVASGRARRHRRVLGLSRSLGSELDVLDDLARARLPESLPGLFRLLATRERTVRTMALRAAARSIAAMAPSKDRIKASKEFLSHLKIAGLSRTALDEALLLLEDAAEPVVAMLLREPVADVRILSAALDSAGRLHLLTVASQVARHLHNGEPTEVRAAALRAIANLSVLPKGAERDLYGALYAPSEAVRIQAARAATLLEPSAAVPALEKLLGDGSWWVRRAAGESLAKIPGSGPPALLAAATNHQDRFARDMASRVVRDNGFRHIRHIRRERTTHLKGHS